MTIEPNRPAERNMYNKSLLAVMLMCVGGCSTTSRISDSSNPLDISGHESQLVAKVNELPPTASGGAAPHANAPKPDPESKDIWHHLRSSFTLEAKSNSRIDKERDFYLKYRKDLARAQQEAQPYLRYILDELAKRNLPGELALLPIIESSYRANAQSPQQAAGLWQLVPATGRTFGLEMSRWYDGRKDVIASTDAALDYFARLNQQFDNDWELTLAAYNAGGQTVQKAISSNEAKGKPTDFWSLDLAEQTETYVAKLMALRQIFTEPEQYGIELEPLDNNQQVDVVELDSRIDLNLVAKLTQITMDTLRNLNPGFKGWIADLQGTYRLLLPKDKTDEFKEQLAAIPSDKLIQFKRHKVTPSDTLKGIANRYSTDVELIKQANNLKSEKLKVASTLLIPTPYKPSDQLVSSNDQEPTPAKSNIDG
jgi:membrane-bound lytic murein transglycosylase D